MKEYGKIFTWDELVEKFPDKWVVVENPKLDEAKFIESGKLIQVCNDLEIDDFVLKCYRDGKTIRYDRTTEKNGIGIINAENVEYIVK